MDQFAEGVLGPLSSTGILMGSVMAAPSCACMVLLVGISMDFATVAACALASLERGSVLLRSVLRVRATCIDILT